MAEKILVIDDEANIRELIKFNLHSEGYEIIEAADGDAALSIALAQKPVLIILDLMLPGKDGLEVCKLLKNQAITSSIPIIMLTAKTEVVDKIIGLELGADDYLSKPFSPRELTARVKAVLRRGPKEQKFTGELMIGKLKLNFRSYEAYLDSKKIELTPKEFELLKLFTTNSGKVFSREQLLEKVWGYEYFGDTRTVDVHIRHLRIKLEPVVDVSDAIETVRGVGYRFSSDNIVL